MIQALFPLVREPSGLHAPRWWATEHEYGQIIAWAIVANNLKNILEIGTFMGDTTWYLSRAAEKIGGTVTTVDIKPRALPFTSPVVKQLEGYSDNVWGEEKYDFIYVDGGHSHDEAFRDVVNAVAHLNPGGMVAVHDTAIIAQGIPEVRAGLEAAIKKVAGRWIYFDQGKGLAMGQF